MKFFKPAEPIIKFKSFVGNFAVATPVVAARRLKPKWIKPQTNPDKKFNVCPGMLDYANAGYIITAHTDIHIKANSVGVSVKLGHIPVQHQNLSTPSNFDYEIVDGMCAVNGVKKQAVKILLPWSVQAKSGYSSYVLPAIMHSDFADKIFVYPGVVDHDAFHTINFIFTPIIDCEFTIPAGAPLLQVLPFRRETITAQCDKATDREVDKHTFNTPSKLKHYYRKFLWSKKPYLMQCPYEHRGDK